MAINLLKNKAELEYVNYTEDGNQEFLVAEDSAEDSNDRPPSVLDYSNEKPNGTIYKKTAKWALLVGMALLPLFFLPLTTSALELSKQLLLIVFVSLALVLWLLDVVTSGKLSWRLNPLDKGILGLCGAVGLSTIFSLSKFTSVFGVSQNLNDSFIVIAALTVFYLLTVNTFFDDGSTPKKFLSVSLVVALVFGLLQLFGFYIFNYIGASVFDFTKSRAFNTLGSTNVLGMMAAVSMPMLYRQKVLLFRYFDISKVGALIAFAVLILINWWVLWVVAIAGMVAVVMLESLALSNLKDGFRISRFLFPMVVMVLGVFLVVINFNLVFVKNKLPIEIAPSYKLSAKVIWQVLKEKPIFGYGPENFSIAFDKYGAGDLRNTTLSSIKLSDSTSYLTNIATHNGFLGLASFGFLLWLLIWSLARTAKERLHNLSPENIGVVSSLVATVVAAFFYPFNMVLTFAFYMFFALVVLALWKDKIVTYDIEKRASLSLVSSLGFIGGLILALVGLYFVSLGYVSNLKYFKALNVQDNKESFENIVEAIRWKGYDAQSYRVSSQLALKLLSQEINTPLSAGDTERNNRIQNHLSSAVALAQKATQIAPNETDNWSNLGDIYQNLMQLVDGADSLAESAYLKASELRPGDPIFYNRIGSMYLIKAELLRQLAISGNISAQQFNQRAKAALVKSEDYFKKAIDLSDKFGLAIYNLGIAYERQGKVSEAIVQLEKLAPFNNNKPGFVFELGLLYYRVNEKDKAVEQLKKAVILSPDFANARWYLALIYEERSKIDEAIEQLEKILSIEVNKGNEIVTKKLEELKSGKISIPPKKVLDQKPL